MGLFWLHQVVGGREPLVGREQDRGAEPRVCQVSQLGEGLFEPAILRVRTAERVRCLRDGAARKVDTQEHGRP